MTMPPGSGSPHRDPHGVEVGSFVTHTPGRWCVTEVPGRDPRNVALDELLAAIEALDHGHMAPDDTGSAFEGVTVAPAWCVVGLLTGQGLVIEDPSGATAVLGPDELRLLDALVGPQPAGDVLRVPGLAAPTTSLARLLDTGTARVVHPASGGTPDHAVAGPPPPSVLPSGTPDPGGPAGRVPVYAVWHPHVGPMLSLGMLTAAARAHDDGALGRVFEIRRPESAPSFLADLAGREGPAVLLCSDYVWSVNENLALAREARSLNPALVVVHGGPSCPKYEGDARRFLDEHGDVAHVLARGEGERTIGELLTALAGSLPRLDAERLAEVDGLTFRDDAGQVVRTPDRERIARLDDLPSPYLTGEYDHIPLDAWWYGMSVETNRGCPYGCTFCDWGSATLSRIRRFAEERVIAEVAWGAARGIHGVTVTDANFGIMSRDVELAEGIARITRDQGRPTWVSVSPAKNTMRHLARIMDVFLDVGVVPTMSISLQTTDAPTAEAIDRNSISIGQYVALAAEHRRHGFPLQGDVLVGLPEQTFDSFRRDLQFNLDHEILVRTWPVQLLPNAPMNDPAYKARYGIVSDDDNIVIATSSFTVADRARMFRLRHLFVVAEVFGLFRHVLRWVQWDHGIDATAVMDHLLDVVELTPMRFPHLTWLAGYFDVFQAAPVGWRHVGDELRALLVEDYSIEASTALEAVLEVQRFLLPAPGRRFPDTMRLPHDYVAYYRDGTADLFTTGQPGRPPAPLEAYGPGELTVARDPLRLCDDGPELFGDSRAEVVQGDFYMASTSAYELYSPLVRLLPHVVRNLAPEEVRRVIPDPAPNPASAGAVEPVTVDLPGVGLRARS